MNPDGTTDVNLRSWYGPDNNGGTTQDLGVTVSAQPYTAALKFTRQLRDFVGTFGTVYAGSENVADVNDRTWVSLRADKWVLDGSKYGFTVKGGSYAILSGLVSGFGKECDVDFGNYSDQQPRGKSSGRLNLWRQDRSPIRVRCIQADKPELVDGSGPYEFVRPNPEAWWKPIFVEFFLFVKRNALTKNLIFV